MNQSTEHKTKHRLAFQLGAPVLVFVTLVFLVLLVLTLYSYGRERSDALTIPREIAHEANADIGVYLDRLESNLNLAVHSVDYASSFTEGDAMRFLENIVKGNPSILELVFYDTAGNALTHVAEPTVRSLDQNFYQDPWQHVPEHLPYLTAPKISGFNTPYVVWWFPVIDQLGAPAGAMSATVDVTSLWEIVSQYAETTPGEIYILDSDGYVLVARDLAGSEMRTRMSGIAGVYDFPHPGNEVKRYPGLSGQTVAGFALPIEGTPWLVVAEVSFRDLVAAAERNLMLFGLLTYVLLVLFLYEVYIFRRALLWPIAEFINKSAELATGNYKVRVQVNEDNELGSLARTFNAMADNIDRETSENVERLQHIIEKQNESAKLLVRRDHELSRANERLQTVSKAKSDFVSVVAHQLRTPLSSIKWTLKMAIDGDLGEITNEQKSYLMKGYESNERLIALVNDLLDVDRIESGSYQFNFVPTQVRDLVENTIAELEPRAKEGEVTMVLEKSKKKPKKVKLDQVKIRAVVQNLIENAIKYTPAQGTVSVSVEEQDGAVLVAVSDTGIGIPQEEQQEIFGRFFRATNAVRHEKQGAGIGLFMSQQIIEKHGGKIWFESTEGAGTTFTFTLPLNK
jgi:signal transduction histidine kinase